MTGMGPVKALIIVAAIALGTYRVITRRRDHLTFLQCLGIAFDRQGSRDGIAGVLLSVTGVAVVFGIEIGSGLSRITGFSSFAVLTHDWITWLMVPAIEELVFRAALLGGMLAVWTDAPWRAIALSALIFGAAHALNPGAPLLATIGSTAGGLIYGIAFVATRRIWLPVALHFGWNWSQGPLFGFPLSGGLVRQGSLIHLVTGGPALLTGGSYGPEGGFIGILGRLIVAALLFAYLRRASVRWGSWPGAATTARASLPSG